MKLNVRPVSVLHTNCTACFLFNLRVSLLKSKIVYLENKECKKQLKIVTYFSVIK